MELYIKNTFNLTTKDISKPITLNGNIIGVISNVNPDFIKLSIMNKYMSVDCSMTVGLIPATIKFTIRGIKDVE